MKLILKIAAGVFLGALAVMLVTRIIPDRIAKQRADDLYMHRSAIVNITPDKMIAKCGKPMKEKTFPSADGTGTVRILSYKQDHLVHNFEFVDFNNSGSWLLEDMDAGRIVVDDTQRDRNDLLQITADELQILMPCVGK